MCDKHKPILLYDGGGTQTICEKCGAVLSTWKPNSGNNGKHKEESKKSPVHNVQSVVK